MKNRFLLIGLILSFFNFFAYSQDWLIDDFNASSLGSQWGVTGSTFAIEIEGNQLKAVYNRNSNSGQWDQFHWNADQDIEISSFSIQFKLKSSVDFKLAVKPVFEDESSHWLEKDIAVSSEFSDIELQAASNTKKKLSNIYFYFDGGTTASKSGTVFIDDLKIKATISTEKLDELVAFAKLYHDNISSEDYPADSISSFNNKIKLAEETLSTADNQDAINQALENLHLAFANIEASYITPEKLSTTNLANKLSTKETKILYYNLKEQTAEKFLFGHQDATGYGVGWDNDDDRSDVKSVCGSYPALAGWGLRGIAKGETDDRAVYRVKKFYRMGAVNAFEWHMDNPLGGDFYWDNRSSDQKPVPTLLPNGEKHDFYKSQLKNLANFFRSLKGDQGESIPVIFRPFHEHTGDWFWWGKAHCSINEYKELWQFTVEFLRDSLHIHNVIYAYSPDRFSSREEYLERYPGDGYIDILGFDDYWNLQNSSGKNNFINELEIVGQLSTEKNKICALTETGLEGITDNTWFTQLLLDPILTNSDTKKIAFAMVWRNANNEHHYAPYPGHTSVADFINFYNNPATIFVDDNLPELYKLNMATSVFEPQSTRENKFYPNPASSKIFIDAAKESQMTLFNSAGTVIDQFKEQLYDISIYPPGIYFLKVDEPNNESITDKLIIK